MGERVTIQDIADALGLSRNTVSKAINNTGILADATKEKVLLKAMEMGYKTFSMPLPKTSADKEPESPVLNGEIALFTGALIENSHFSSTMLDKCQYELAMAGYSLSMHRITEDNLRNKTLPITFLKGRTSAIMCIEIFNEEYCKMLETLQIPLLLIDAPAASYASQPNADVLLMENTAPIFQMIYKLKEQGFKSIGYIGQKNHCRSFFERYLAYRNAMDLLGLPVDPQYCITEPTTFLGKPEYRNYLYEQLNNLKQLPELFICANDFVALDLIHALTRMGKSVPKDICIAGFDDSPESKVITPRMSTCHIHSQIMGLMATQLLLSRIEYPDMNYRTVHTETSLMLRESTVRP